MTRQSIGWLTGLFTLLATLTSAPAAEQQWGMLLLAHGVKFRHPETGELVNIWNRNVERMAEQLDEAKPTPVEVAFGMADPEPIQKAIDKLEDRGSTHIATIPVFVSSHSPIIGNFRYILGLQPHLAETTQLTELQRVETEAQIVFASPMDDHPLISEILLERAKAVASQLENTTVVLIAHGPNTVQENRRWLEDLSVHAAYLEERATFREIRYITHRNDAPEAIKAQARKDLRQAVAKGTEQGEVVVVPVLLSAGGIEDEVRADLEGLDYRWAKPLLPHPNVQRWVERQFRALTSQ